MAMSLPTELRWTRFLGFVRLSTDKVRLILCRSSSIPFLRRQPDPIRSARVGLCACVSCEVNGQATGESHMPSGLHTRPCTKLTLHRTAELCNPVRTAKVPKMYHFSGFDFLPHFFMILKLTIPFIFWAAGRRYDCVNLFTTATQSLNADPDGTPSPDGSTDRTSHKNFPERAVPGGTVPPLHVFVSRQGPYPGIFTKSGLDSRLYQLPELNGNSPEGLALFSYELERTLCIF